MKRKYVVSYVRWFDNEFNRCPGHSTLFMAERCQRKLDKFVHIRFTNLGVIYV